MVRGAGAEFHKAFLVFLSPLLVRYRWFRILPQSKTAVILQDHHRLGLKYSALDCIRHAKSREQPREAHPQECSSILQRAKRFDIRPHHHHLTNYGIFRNARSFLDVALYQPQGYNKASIWGGCAGTAASRVCSSHVYGGTYVGRTTALLTCPDAVRRSSA